MLKAPVAEAQGASPASLQNRVQIDPGTVIGLVAGLGSVVYSYVMEGGELGGLFNLPALLIVFGGTLGAATVSSPLSLVLSLPRILVKAVMSKAVDELALIGVLIGLAETARREGLLALENMSSGLGDPFLQRGIQMVVDGAEPETVREVLELDLEQMAARHERSYGLLEAMGGFAPTMGIIGTVMGLVHVLGSLSDPSKLGPAISVAFIATLYGVASANLLWLPLASKLRKQSERELTVRRLIVMGLLVIQAGENPRVVREKLLGFVPPARRKVGRQNPVASPVAGKGAA